MILGEIKAIRMLTFIVHSYKESMQREKDKASRRPRRRCQWKDLVTAIGADARVALREHGHTR